MAIDRQGTALAVLRICIGVFFIFEGLGKIRWFTDSSILAGQLAGWHGALAAGSIGARYIERLAMPRPGHRLLDADRGLRRVLHGAQFPDRQRRPVPLQLSLERLRAAGAGINTRAGAGRHQAAVEHSVNCEMQERKNAGMHK